MNNPKVLLEWLEPIRRWRKNCIEIIVNTEQAVKVQLYTANHCYSISARRHDDRENGYIGCIGWSRMPRPGEEQFRGNDLHDGQFTKENFDAIMMDIVAYELQELAPKYEPQIGWGANLVPKPMQEISNG